MLGLEKIELFQDFSDQFAPVDKRFTIKGVAASRDIKHREAILAVPFSLLISPRTFQEEEAELFEFVQREAPDLFDDKEQLDQEQLLITFFLMHEWTKGKQSKWYAAIGGLPKNQKFFCDWD